MSATIANAFDAVAETYDARFTDSRVGIAHRQAVWQVVDRVFTPGMQVLEINCGTGVDAAHLAARGVRVHACDVSPAMIEVARRRLRGTEGVEVEIRSTEDLDDLRGDYDGVLSNFGGLNCVRDLPATLHQLRRLVRVGGDIFLCIMGRFCAWEVFWYARHLQFRKAVRRWQRTVRASISGGNEFSIQYPTVASMARTLQPHFRLVRSVGIGVFVPPSYAEPLVVGHPRLFTQLMRLDQVSASWPGFRCSGDHILLHFKKVCE